MAALGATALAHLVQPLAIAPRLPAIEAVTPDVAVELPLLLADPRAALVVAVRRLGHAGGSGEHQAAQHRAE